MNCIKRRMIGFLLLVVIWQPAAAAPSVEKTTVLGPFIGVGATLHPENQSPHLIEFYGADLGFSYQHGGKLHFLFGDSWAVESYAPIEKSTGARHDDGFGMIDIAEWPDSGKITSDNIPMVKLGQNPGTTEMSAINPGYISDMVKTPIGGFSNGENEYGIFNTVKPQGCLVDSDCDSHLVCDNGLGYSGSRYDDERGLTLACIDSSSKFCNADTMLDDKNKPVANSGLCLDVTSTNWTNTEAGRTWAIGFGVRIGVRDKSDPRKYTNIKSWLTNKFLNISARTVNSFVPANGAGHANQDYKLATESGENRRVLLWGRPGFGSVNAKGRTLGVYFAYVDMPVGADFEWKLNYYTGINKNGIPQFSPNEVDAKPVDLDATVPGVQVKEIHDLVQHMSVAWVDHLKKWVMFYGGGTSTLPTVPFPDCGLLQIFASTECEYVAVGNGAVRMRMADDPWGPWTPPQDVIVGGDPAVPGSGLYGVGGVLAHPACTQSGCAPRSNARFYGKDEYGFLYGVNIVAEWIKPVGNSVDIFWNASTSNPHRVVLLRTRIKP